MAVVSNFKPRFLIKRKKCMIQSEMDFGSVGIVGILHQFRNSQCRTRQLTCCLTEPTDSASHLSETFAHGGPWSLVFFSLATFVNESLERFAKALDDANDERIAHQEATLRI